MNAKNVSRLFPGFIAAALVAALAYAAKWSIGGAVMLYALLLGMPMHFLMRRPAWAPGVEFTAKRVLRFGVALLGVRITLADASALGVPTLALVVSAVVFTLTVGFAAARLFKLDKDFAMLSAGAVAICGASAALAIAAVLPATRDAERNTILTVVAVTALSTVAMIVYPLLVGLLGYTDVTAGVFLGASIHDVAQVVGAGYTVSPQAGDTATLVKLTRVACLVPAVACIAWLFRQRHADAGSTKVPALPLFLLSFVALMLVNSAGLLPAEVVAVLRVLSEYCLVIAVAALGIKTSLRGLVSVGFGPIGAIVSQTLLLAVFVIAVLAVIGPG
ncbi:MAG: putative sulfate exporter family transporter [Pseudomonadota bacterium]